jgi:hypothetical protein
MAVIGEIIKRAISITGSTRSDRNFLQAQTNVLSDLLNRAKLTAFGKKYNFKNILLKDDLVEAFQKNVPIYDYDKLYKEWWHYLLEGHQNITWPGGQHYFALSSGTTSNSKYIPVTDDMLEAIKKSGIQQILSLKNFNLSADFFEKQIFMLGSSTQLIQKDDHLEGEISGISAVNIPFWFKSFYKPGERIAAIENWDDKIHKIAQLAPKWDIGSITGIPSWIELMLKEVIRYNNVNTIHDLWPNLRIYTSGGVAFDPYRKSFEKLLSYPITYIDTYLASEGYLATQKRPNVPGMALIVDNGVFFEFVPFTDANIDEKGMVKQNAEVLTIADVQEEVDYVLLISTVAGAWRYMIGDTVMFTDKQYAEIKITGRTKHYLNVVGEQLSVYQMNAAMQQLEREYNTVIKEFTVGALLNNGEYVNKWFIGTEQHLNPLKVADILDKHLRTLNKNYNVARNKALKSVEVKLIPVDMFYKWSEETKKLGGQVKIPRVMKEEELLVFEKFINALP